VAGAPGRAGGGEAVKAAEPLRKAGHTCSRAASCPELLHRRNRLLHRRVYGAYLLVVRLNALASEGSIRSLVRVHMQRDNRDIALGIRFDYPLNRRTAPKAMWPISDVEQRDHLA
jgi:hypothetical protein